jgi:hypothetical protein
VNAVLFAVGIFIFMITVYGTVMAGGASLKRKQKAELAPDQDLVVNDDGWEVIEMTEDPDVPSGPSRRSR